MSDQNVLDNYKESLVKKFLVNDSNKATYSTTQTIHQLFEEQVNKSPHAVALIFEDKQMTYQQLNSRANQLAHYIREKYLFKTGNNLPRDTLICLLLDRSFEMIVSILAVLKSGAAYVPISPDFPIERINYILEDTDTKFLISQQHLQSKISELRTEDLKAIYADSDVFTAYKTDNLKNIALSDSLSYVIYTSGTTGKPKGVMIEHKSYSSFITAFSSKLSSVLDYHILSLTNYVFDIFGLEYALPLIKGGKVILSSIDKVSQKEIDQSIIIQQTPQVLYELCKKDIFGLKSKVCLVGGEKSSFEIVDKLLSSFKEVYNLYGPAETVIWSSIYKFPHAKHYQLIGQALPNESLLVLDKDMSLCDANQQGELYISGVGLARGYLNLPKLTKEKFIDNPFATEEDIKKGYTKLYKTADICKWLDDGNIAYIGRSDFQVKIRGFRIELGEIESVIGQLESIEQVCVIAKEKIKTGTQYIAAYVVFKKGKHLSFDQIKQKIQEKLPDYMIPSAFVELDTFPLTINGKLDRSALPTPQFNDQSQYVAPRNENEKKLCQIWQEILEVDKVGVEDDFFKLGGDSITAIQCAGLLSKTFNKHISSSTIFNNSSISLLSDSISKVKNNLKAIPVINQQYYPLSFAQKRFYFIEQLEQGTNAYHLPMLFTLSSDINIIALEMAIDEIIKQSPILRTAYKQLEDTHLVQWEKSTTPVIEHKKVSNYDQYQKLLSDDINAPFDLTNDYPLRVCIYSNEKANQRHLLINIHHIAIDGWSLDILSQSLLKHYCHFSFNDKLELPKKTIEYKDFSVWEKQQFSSETIKRHTDYWCNKLKDFEPLDLSLDKNRPVRFDYKGDDVFFTFEEDLSRKINALSSETGFTTYHILLSGFFILLYKYTQQNDLVIGTPVANREHYDLKNIVGCFINNLVFRMRINDEDTALNILQRVYDDFIDMQPYQSTPFDEVVNKLELEKDMSRHPIFQVMFSVQRFKLNSAQGFDKYFTQESVSAYHKVAKFDLTCLIDDSEKEIKGVINYASSLFYRDRIERMVDHYQVILNQVIDSYQSKKVSSYDVLTAKEYQTIVYDWNKTESDYPKDKTIHQLFEEQVNKSPHAVALVFEDKEMTYQELNEKSNQLAYYIRDSYLNTTGNILPRDTLICLLLDRSFEIIISILAVLKSGAAYVPISPDFPVERINYILEDTGTKFLISQQHLHSKISELRVEGLKAIYADSDVFTSYKTDNLKNIVLSDSLAYVIYTSGTTGKPKGVMIEHKALTSTILSSNNVYKSNRTERASFYSSYIFDVSIAEIFCPLTLGYELHVLSELCRKDITKLSEYLFENKISYVFLPPIVLSVLDKEKNYSFKSLMFAGESCNLNTAKYWSSNYSLYNLYAPSESCIYSIYKKVLPTDINIIGKPFNNEKVYVLNEDMSLCDVNQQGELYISGIGLARGYLNLPKLTKEKFIDNPFATEADIKKGYTKLYKTGDICKWLDDGNIAYIGRSDFQVKIRGFRIEIGEIESVIGQLEPIEQVCVIAKEKIKTSTQYLAAYVVFKKGKHLSFDQIKQKVQEKLPDYMIPSAFVELDTFPLTINGKLDRSALPAPKFNDQSQYVAPRNEDESRICHIWQEVLEVDRVGIDDDFFKLGGDSILSIKMSYMMSEVLGKKIMVTDIFSYKTISRILRQSDENNGFNAIRNLGRSKIESYLGKIYFIHPAFSGCEVYRDLIRKLDTHYECLGIENYNLYNDKKIDSLSDLAFFYIKNTSLLKLDKSKNIFFLGWSLGGLIAMEMAYKLELEGYKNIKVIILDSHINNNEKIKYHPHFNETKGGFCMKDYIHSVAKNIDKNNRKRYYQCAEVDEKIGKSTLSGVLKKTVVYSLIATRNIGYKYKYNNLYKYSKKSYVAFIDADHFTLIDTIIKKWNNYKEPFIEFNFSSISKNISRNTISGWLLFYKKLIIYLLSNIGLIFILYLFDIFDPIIEYFILFN